MTRTRPQDALTDARLFYVTKYSADDFDPLEALGRLAGPGPATMTLAELNALEYAGLAVGYHVRTTTAGPLLTPLGREALR